MGTSQNRELNAKFSQQRFQLAITQFPKCATFAEDANAAISLRRDEHFGFDIHLPNTVLSSATMECSLWDAGDLFAWPYTRLVSLERDGYGC